MRSCVNRPVTPKDKLVNELISIYMNGRRIDIDVYIYCINFSITS